MLSSLVQIPLLLVAQSYAPHFRCWAVSSISGHLEPLKDFLSGLQLLAPKPLWPLFPSSVCFFASISFLFPRSSLRFKFFTLLIMFIFLSLCNANLPIDDMICSVLGLLAARCGCGVLFFACFCWMLWVLWHYLDFILPLTLVDTQTCTVIRVRHLFHSAKQRISHWESFVFYTYCIFFWGFF